MSEIEAKLVKQLEYYFGDFNLAKDKHLKELISKSTDGWVSYDDLFKFPRLKEITEDKSLIKDTIQKSGSIVIEANDEGIRRLNSFDSAENIQELADKHLDKSLYVKGFSTKETIDSIIGYLETHGGPTVNVHMRRMPKDKSFKGSVFVIFKTIEDCEKFLSNEEAEKFNDNTMTRMWQKDYLASKKAEHEERHKEKELRLKEANASKEALLQAKMTKGALIELSFVEKSDLPADVKGDFAVDARDERTATKNLKTWLSEVLVDVAQVSWVEYFPITGKVIVRMNKENSAELALKKLYESEHAVENKEAFSYQIYEFSGVILADEREKDYWRNILVEQTHKRTRGRNDRNAGGPNKKRMRR